MNTPTVSRPFPRVLRFTLRALLIAWAGFWAWFVVAVSLGEPPAPPLWIPVAWIAGLATAVVLCWRWPALGGSALVAAGLWSASVFPHPGARALLALPAIALGLGCLAEAWGARRVAHAALVLLALPFVGCLASQDPADLPYRTGSILRHEDGALKRAYLVEETELAGLPCRGYAWWYEDGSVDNVELAEERDVQGHRFPGGTRIFFDRDGRLAHAWLSETTTIDGRPCRGRWKIDTAFHPNGRVRAFFPPDTIEIDGVACAASVFAPVYLHPDGRLRQCRLARELTLDGRTFEKGDTLRLDESGHAL